MNFEDALAAMRSGGWVKRPAFRSLRASFTVGLNSAQTGFISRPSSGSDSAWTISNADALATDWAIA